MSSPKHISAMPMCRICQDVYREPKILTCLHSFCADCLKPLASNQNSQDCLASNQNTQPDIECPVCGCHTTLSTSGVQGLTTHSLLKRIGLEYLEKVEKTRQRKHHLSSNSAADNGDDTNPEQSLQFPETNGATNSENLQENVFENRVSTRNGNPSRFAQELDTPQIQSEESIKSNVHDGISSVNANTNESEASNLNKEQSLNEEAQDGSMIQQVNAECEDKKSEAWKISENIQSRLMHCQGEALRITYAIENVNQTVNNWRENTAELRTRIEERSATLQHFIRRQEKKLTAEVESRAHEEEFMANIDRAKYSLRSNLKHVLQAIEFLKQLQHYASDEEKLDMQGLLLADLATLSEVQITSKEYEVKFPIHLPEDIVADEFGGLTLKQNTFTAFAPNSFKYAHVTEGSHEAQLARDREALSAAAARRRRRKQRRLTSLDPQEWKVAEKVTEPPPEVSPNRLNDLKESLLQRRRDLHPQKTRTATESIDARDAFVFDVQKKHQSSKKRRYHSFGGRSALSPAPPDLSKVLEMYKRNQETIADQSPRQNDADSPSEQQKTVESEPSDLKACAQLMEEDRSSKLKFLRESWRKRREILISNEGFLAPSPETSLDEGSNPVSPKSPDSKEDKFTKFEDFKRKLAAIRNQFHGDSNSNDISEQSQVIIDDAHNKTENLTNGNDGRIEETETEQKANTGTFTAETRGRIRTRDTGSNHQTVYTDASPERGSGEKHDPSQQNSGLTRIKLQKMRENMRRKTERWRSSSVS